MAFSRNNNATKEILGCLIWIALGVSFFSNKGNGTDLLPNSTENSQIDEYQGKSTRGHGDELGEDRTSSSHRGTENLAPPPIGTTSTATLQPRTVPVAFSHRGGKPLHGLTLRSPHEGLDPLGFKTEKISGGAHLEIRSTLTTPKGRYSLSSFGPNEQSVTGINATFSGTPGAKTDGLAKTFFTSLATLDYQGAEPGKLSEWIAEHIGRTTTIEIGSCHFQLFDAGRTRILRITTAAAE